MTDASALPFLRWRAGLPDLSGLDDDEAYGAFLAAHGDRCGSCRQPFDLRGKRVLDHDHRTGLVRAWLCHGCNVAMPSHVLFGSLARSRRAAATTAYTQFPPAAAARYRALYSSAWGKDPAPDLHREMWHASPEGLHQRGAEELRDRMEQAMDAILTL